MANTYSTRKKVIYSALVGAYDEIQQPKAVSSEFDYILFTDTVKVENVGVWQVRAIPYENADNTRRARWVKTHPHLLLPDYDYCVWTDANVRIASEEAYQLFDDLYESGTQIASFVHPERDCVYEEALAVMLGNRDVIDKILLEILFLKRHDYPQHNGLFETNCFFLRLKDARIQRAFDEWWSMIDHFSRRDQLSCNYALWRHGIKPAYLLPAGYSARNHPYFEYVLHSTGFTSMEWEWIVYLMGEVKDTLTVAYRQVVETETETADEQAALNRFVKTLYSLHRSFIFSYLEPRRRDMEKGLQDLQAACRHYEQQVVQQQETISVLEARLAVKRHKYLQIIRLLIAVILVLAFVIILLCL